MADILFADKTHEELFFSLFKRMKRKDCYHGAAAYLLGLDTVLRDHINSVFDFDEDVIKPECIYDAWQTGTSTKTTRLLFNLWNGTHQDTEPDKDQYDEDEEEDTEELLNRSSRYYSPEELFCCSYAPFFVQAIQLRYPEYF